MFKKNEDRTKGKLFTQYRTILTEKQLKKLQSGWSGKFKEEIFSNIDEAMFMQLYSAIDSRPNSPVNVLVGLLIYKEMKSISYDELIEQFNYNAALRYALGCDGFKDISISRRTLFNFLGRIAKHIESEGRDLFYDIFSNLSRSQLRKYGIKSTESRVDSTLIWSNIKNENRLGLVLKVLNIFWSLLKSLELEKTVKLKEKEKEIVDINVENYLYYLSPGSHDLELKKAGRLIYKLLDNFKGIDSVKETSEYKQLSRVFDEHFALHSVGKKKKGKQKKQVLLKPTEELTGKALQSPYDDEATYRKKGDKSYKGYALNAVETCSDENHVNLITDIQVDSNTTSDGKLLEKSLDVLKETGVERVIGDAGYIEKDLSEKLSTEDIELIATRTKGRSKANDRFYEEHFKIEDGKVISCPIGHAPMECRETEKSVIAYFSTELCSNCKHRDKCIIKQQKKSFVLRLTQEKFNNLKLLKRVTEYGLYNAIQKRAAVECTIGMLKSICHGGKSRYRGLQRIKWSFIFRAIGVNFRRLFLYFWKYPGNDPKYRNNSPENSSNTSILLNAITILIRCFHFFLNEIVETQYRNYNCNLKLVKI